MNNSRNNELDVAFIGSQDQPLTKAEEKSISDFIQMRKAENARKQKRAAKSSAREKATS